MVDLVLGYALPASAQKKKKTSKRGQRAVEVVWGDELTQKRVASP